MRELTTEERAEMATLTNEEKSHALKHRLVEDRNYTAEMIREHYAAVQAARPKPPTTGELRKALDRLKLARTWWPDAELALTDNTREALPDGARFRGVIRIGGSVKLADVVAFLVSAATMLTCNTMTSELTYDLDLDDEQHAGLLLTIYWST